jgi:hypothetical protein
VLPQGLITPLPLVAEGQAQQAQQGPHLVQILYLAPSLLLVVEVAEVIQIQLILLLVMVVTVALAGAVLDHSQ